MKTKIRNVAAQNVRMDDVLLRYVGDTVNERVITNIREIDIGGERFVGITYTDNGMVGPEEIELTLRPDQRVKIRRP